MTDEDTIARLAEYWGMSYRHKKPYKSGYKTQYTVDLTYSKAESFLCNAYPYFGLRRQSKIREVLGYTPEPNPDVRFSEWSWFVGYVEGEGCFREIDRVPIIQIRSTDRDIVERSNHILRALSIVSRKPDDTRKICHTIRSKSIRSGRLMRRMQPFMSKRRQEKIQEIMLKRFNIRYHKISPFDRQEIISHIRDKDYYVGMYKDLSEKYGVSRTTIRKIKNMAMNRKTFTKDDV